MLRPRHQTSEKYRVPDSDLDLLVRGIRRLVLHRGFVRCEIESPLLKRFTPARGEFDESGVRMRLASATLDPTMLAYLKLSLDTELDSARLRLT